MYDKIPTKDRDYFEQNQREYPKSTMHTKINQLKQLDARLTVNNGSSASLLANFVGKFVKVTDHQDQHKYGFLKEASYDSQKRELLLNMDLADTGSHIIAIPRDQKYSVVLIGDQGDLGLSSANRAQLERLSKRQDPKELVVTPRNNTQKSLQGIESFYGREVEIVGPSSRAANIERGYINNGDSVSLKTNGEVSIELSKPQYSVDSKKIQNHGKLIHSADYIPHSFKIRLAKD